MVRELNTQPDKSFHSSPPTQKPNITISFPFLIIYFIILGKVRVERRRKRLSLARKDYVKTSENPLKGSGIKKELFEASVLDIYKQLLITKDDDGVSYGEKSCEAVCQRFRRSRCAIRSLRDSQIK